MHIWSLNIRIVLHCGLMGFPIAAEGAFQIPVQLVSLNLDKPALKLGSTINNFVFRVQILN